METLQVLVVDDEVGIRSGIQRILSRHSVSFPFMEEDFNYNILTVESGEEALDILGTQKIDIVLLDNKLPGIEGIEVLGEMQKRGYSAVVMMITSYASLDLAVKATQIGAYNFVPKPFNPQELKLAIENITKHLILKRLTTQADSEERKNRLRFLSILSHELKSPINPIEGYLRIMKDAEPHETIDNYKQMIDRSMERLNGMRTLIMDILDLTRLETGKDERIPEIVDLTNSIQKAIDSIQLDAQAKQVTIDLQIEGSPKIKALESEMDIIMNNLITNSVKYNKTGGEVHCKIIEQEESVKITVKDTGIGMSEDEIARLFQEFVRIKNAKTRNITGSGLGLSILKKLVSGYKGEVFVNSTPDKGSKFTVILPKGDIK